MDVGVGETKAILLANRLDADLVLMDDLAGRKAALKMGLSVTGTLSVLGIAARFGLLNLEDSITQLKRLGFRTSDKLIQEIMAEYGNG